MAASMVFHCPNDCHKSPKWGGWGSSANGWEDAPCAFPAYPRDMLIRLCHGCYYRWPEAEDWKHFKLVESFDSAEEYLAAWERVYNGESCSEQSPWERLLGS